MIVNTGLIERRLNSPSNSRPLGVSSKSTAANPGLQNHIHSGN
jgi:hypothetical protein